MEAPPLHPSRRFSQKEMEMTINSKQPQPRQRMRYTARSSLLRSTLPTPAQSQRISSLAMSRVLQHPDRSSPSSRSRPRFTCPITIKCIERRSVSREHETKYTSCASNWTRSQSTLGRWNYYLRPCGTTASSYSRGWTRLRSSPRRKWISNLRHGRRQLVHTLVTSIGSSSHWSLWSQRPLRTPRSPNYLQRHSSWLNSLRRLQI
eukprot:1442601-Pyramimonas_sp.AAC.1